MLAVTAGTFYQKRYIHSGDLRTVTILQYAGAIAVTLPVAWLIEPMRLEIERDDDPHHGCGRSSLSRSAPSRCFLLLIRRGEVSRAAQLIYLIPPTAAVQAWLLFGETAVAAAARRHGADRHRRGAGEPRRVRRHHCCTAKARLPSTG